ncbi:MAG TPA: ABC transporter permease [Tepidiformaceae bacterium]|nr:ABC transporter permease [Tepidiformaceae bacterium]
MAVATLPNEIEVPATDRTRDSLFLTTILETVRNPMGATGLVVVLALVALGFAAPLIAPHDPLQQIRGHRLEGPSAEFWFGTDEFSRDIFSRTLYGLRASILVSIFAVGGFGLAGTIAGFTAGYARGWLDTIMMRIVDSMLAFPGLLMAIAILAALGAGIQNVALAIGIGAFPRFARLGRAQMLLEGSKDYVLAARVTGASEVRIMFRHVAINALPPILVQAALSMAGAVLIEASLGYLGLGTEPPQPSLGNLINGARAHLDKWTYFAFPGAILGLFLVGLNLLADATNEAMDPHRRRR